MQIASEYANVSYITHVRVSHDFATPREGATQNKLLFDPKTNKVPEVFWRKFCKIPCSLPIEGQRHPDMNVLRNIQFIYSSTTHAHTHRTHASHTLTPHTHTHTHTHAHITHKHTHHTLTHTHARTHTHTCPRAHIITHTHPCTPTHQTPRVTHTLKQRTKKGARSIDVWLLEPNCAMC